jgi:hypothetical protein
MTDLRPPLDSVHGTFAVPATITLPGGAPIATSIVRLPRPPLEMTNRDGSIVVKYERHVFAIRLDQVPAPTKGTLVIAEGQVWMIESIENQDDELIEAAMIRMPS